MSIRTVVIVLAVLLAAVGIGTAVAWEAGVFERYAEYRARGQTIEAMNLSADFRMGVMETWLDRSRLPRDASETAGIVDAMLARPEMGVERIEVRGGTIVLFFGGDRIVPQLRKQVLAISPCFDADDMIQWSCGQAVCAPGLRAAQGAPPAFTLTTLQGNWLPASCRGPGPEALALRDDAAQGNFEAQASWAALLWDGQITPMQRGEAVRLARSAAGNGSAQGMAILGYMLSQGDPEVLEPDAVEAHVWFSRAIAAGHPKAQGLRDQLEHGMSDEQRTEAQARAGNL